MPSVQHETPLILVSREPEILTRLLSLFAKITLPEGAKLRAYPTETRSSRSVRNSDAVQVVEDRHGNPLMVIILEVQQRFRAEKLRSWKAYLAEAELALQVPAVLLVYSPSSRVKERYRQAVLKDGISLLVRPILFSTADTPLIVDPLHAVACPGMAVWSAMAHSDETHIDQAFPALLAALQALGETDSKAYHDFVLAGLPADTKTRWRDFMTTTIYRSTGTPYLSEEFNEVYTEGQAEGEAKGLVWSLHAVLDARDIKLTKTARELIESTTDSTQLATWLARAATATELDEVLNEQTETG